MSNDHVQVTPDSSGKLIASQKVNRAGPSGAEDVHFQEVILVDAAGVAIGKAEDAAAASGDAGVLALGVRNDAGAARTNADGDYGAIALDSAGRIKMVLEDGQAATLGTIADAAVDSDTTGTISGKLRGLVKLLVAGITVAVKAATTGGCSPIKVISAATTNGTSVKASAGQIYWLVVTNTNAAVRYLKLYNKASAPTVGTDVPVLTIPIPGNTAGGGFSIAIPPGQAFATGIALALTTGSADADTGAVAAGEIVVAGGYL